MLVSRTLITLVPLIYAGCVGVRRFVGSICENLRQICGICVPLCQAIPRFTNNVFVRPSNSKFARTPSADCELPGGWKLQK